MPTHFLPSSVGMQCFFPPPRPASATYRACPLIVSRRGLFRPRATTVIRAAGACRWAAPPCATATGLAARPAAASTPVVATARADRWRFRIVMALPGVGRQTAPPPNAETGMGCHSVNGLAARSEPGPTAADRSEAHPRIEHGVDDVDQDVRHHHARG